MKKFIVVFTLVFLSGGCSSSIFKDCLQNRAAFDIGSGTTKMKVAKVDVCERKIVRILYEDRRRVPYKASSKKNKGIFTAEIVQLGIKTLKKMMDEAKEFVPVKYFAVATSAFRTASNSWVVVERAKKELNLEIKVISQDAEGELGFFAGLGKADVDEEDLVVWDIGGGSFQITAQGSNNKKMVYNGKLGAIPYRDYVITEVQKKSLKKYDTPNPISLDQSLEGATYVRQKVISELDPILARKIANPNTKVLGIGGVHFYSIRNQIHPGLGVYSIDQLLEALKKRSGLPESKIDSKYSSTEISNLSLVYGFMKALRLKRVYVERVNLSDAVLFLDTFKTM